MLDLIHIRDILEHQRTLKSGTNPNHMSDEADESCRLMIEAIDEGRVQIVAKAE